MSEKTISRYCPFKAKDVVGENSAVAVMVGGGCGGDKRRGQLCSSKKML